MKTGAKILIGVGILAVATTVFIVLRKRSKKKQEELDAQSTPLNLNNVTQTDLQNSGVNTVVVKPDTKPQTNVSSTMGTLFGKVDTKPTTTTATPMKFGDKLAIKTSEEYIYSKPIGSATNRLGTIKSDAKAVYVAPSTGGFSEITVQKYYQEGLFKIPHFSESVVGDRVFIPTERIKKA